MKIQKVTFNNRKRQFEILLKPSRILTLPYSRSEALSGNSQVANAWVDEELGREAITYCTKTGKEGSLHIDAFLDHNQDPDYMHQLYLCRLTLEVEKALQESGLSIREVGRRMGTSASQLYRLVDPANYNKSTDQLLRLLAATGKLVSFTVMNPDDPNLGVAEKQAAYGKQGKRSG